MDTCLAAGRLGGELLCIMSRFSYIYMYGAYPGAYLVTCVSEPPFFCSAHTLAHAHFLNVFASGSRLFAN